jgi:hypothetical protein
MLHTLLSDLRGAHSHTPMMISGSVEMRMYVAFLYLEYKYTNASLLMLMLDSRMYMHYICINHVIINKSMVLY